MLVWLILASGAASAQENADAQREETAPPHEEMNAPPDAQPAPPEPSAPADAEAGAALDAAPQEPSEPPEPAGSAPAEARPSSDAIAPPEAPAKSDALVEHPELLERSGGAPPEARPAPDMGPPRDAMAPKSRTASAPRDAMAPEPAPQEAMAPAKSPETAAQDAMAQPTADASADAVDPPPPANAEPEGKENASSEPIAASAANAQSDAMALEVAAAPSMKRTARLDLLEALWTAYLYRYVEDGRVVSRDEGGITTSEGQGYAMLRAVWADDQASFDRIWTWTKQNLRGRGDRLFAWKWKNGAVVDRHSATDADTDIALALLLASRRFEDPAYQNEALEVVRAIWELEILPVRGGFYPVAGDWARKEPVAEIHVGYLAPYAYQEFAKVDSEHEWKDAVRTSYDILHWLYFSRGVKLPPEKIWVDAQSGELRLEDPKGGEVSHFGYDAFPIFWRVALDATWNWRAAGIDYDVFPLLRALGIELNGEWKQEAELAQLHERMLAPLRAAWDREQRIYDRYELGGRALSKLEALPLYATAHALAELADRPFADQLYAKKLALLRAKALEDRETPYYLHNWVWFDEAFWLGEARRLDEPLGFLMPFDLRSFEANLPVVPLLLCLMLFPIAHVMRGSVWQWPARVAFLTAAFTVAWHYLWWRATNTLNTIEPGGRFISISLYAAEIYCFGSVVLLIVQVGLGRGHRRRRKRRWWNRRQAPQDFSPSVDVLIPIFHEPLEILEQTVRAARAMDYSKIAVHVLDDGHRDEVRELAERLGAHYLRGPREHAKAGNLNAALGQTRGDLVAIFDTDHIPTRAFLRETVPHFEDVEVGVVQTPHVFRNPDIFQRAFRLEGRIPNEADLFNRGIQPARDAWGGSFFVGSGAVFRRQALEEIGGFQVLSITEDIHTCTHMHAAGWRSVFVDKALAVGLAAEDLSSYIVQRRRWMLGCLQVFFRDNPLFRRGLSLRQRLAYFGSLYHFFFPLARIVFWVTPLYYLFFHLHPIFSEVAVLSARLLPYLIVLPLISSVLMPRWPRPFWGPFYETVVAAPLARSMFDLLLPSTLGFKATPKGIVTEGRRFDWRSTRWTMLLAALTLAALVKGGWELVTFGIERDAYFFNMIWASYNLMFLVGALLVAWERPQRRAEERVRCEVSARIENGKPIHAITQDISLSGCSLILDGRIALPYSFDLVLSLNGSPLRLRAELVFHERVGRRELVGVRFIDPPEDARHAILLSVFARSETWERLRSAERRSRFGLASAFLLGFARYFRGARYWTRRYPTRNALRFPRWLGHNHRRSVWLCDVSPGGAGLLCTGRRPRSGELWRISELRWGRVVHARRRFLFLWRVGLEEVEEPADAGVLPAWEHAA
jgi:cellulose synthase (UDP-forming)